MEAKAGVHYGPVFQSHRRLNQGVPLSPTIFNLVVDAIIRHWVTVVGVPQEGTIQGLGESIQTLAALSYANDGLIASPESTCLQEAFGVLSSLFEQVGLRTNKGNIVRISWRLCHTPHA